MGLTLFFWRWPEHYQDIARKGILPMFDSDPPRRLDRQTKYKNKMICKKVKEKLEKMVGKGYIKITDIKFVGAIM